MIRHRSNQLAFCGFLMAASLVLLAGCKTGADVTEPAPTPAAPAGLPVVPSNPMAVAGSGQVNLTWSAGSGATSYHVKRSTTNGGPYTQIASPVGTAFADSSVTNGTMYYYVVSSVNAAGESANSAQVSATPRAVVTAPAAPANLAATAGDAQAALTWSATSGATSYHVKRSTTNGGPYTQIAAPTSASYTDASLTNGTTYYYVVSALNSAGESANSMQASASPAASAPPPAKTIVITPATAVVAYGGTIQFTGAITGSTGDTIVWSIQETGDVGTITSDGRYTASSTAGTVHVVATSSADSKVKATASVAVSAPQGTPPTLTPGVWKNITPPAPGFSSTFGALSLEVSPVDPNVIYVGIASLGLWKSTDRGSNWTRMGTPGNYDFSGKTTYLDTPFCVKVDPADPNHLVATQGVDGATLGFWVSTDGGQHWQMPQGFMDAAAKISNNYDTTSMAVDPTNFNHILLGSHSLWGNKAPGIMETKDGGKTWILHDGVSSWPQGSAGVGFLYDPASGQGDSNTWLVATDGNGFWRTSNAGATWTRVANYDIPHGGDQFYYTKDGTLYAGAAGYPARSHDNGVTWEQVTTGLPNWYYYSIVGDGNTLYTQVAYTGDNGGVGLQPYYSAPEKTGGPWAVYQGGSQKFSDGPFVQRYDAANGIMYSANFTTGVWALKVIKP